jgi:hypothetical protein
MSEANLKMKALFEVGDSKDPSQEMNEATRTEFEASKAVAALKEKVRKKSSLIRWSVVEDILVERTVAVLDIPVLTFLLPAWKKCREIHEFADLKKHPAEEINLVSLAEHTVKVGHSSSLQVTYRGVDIPEAKLEFALAGDLTLEGVVLKIQNGKIKAIEGGQVKWSGELLLENQSVFKNESKPYTLTGSVELQEGMAI